MREAHVNLVSVGIFSWALLEPEPGVYDFGWLDRIIDLLWENGVAVDLATPTAAPPAWLVREHPEVLPVTRDGVRLEFGSRRHYCPSSPVFREATVELVTQLAGRYANHPAIAMWHVGNEYGCHVPACYCQTSAEDFRTWLRARYEEIEGLNRALGNCLLGPALPRLVRDRATAPHPDLRQPDPGARLGAVLVGCPARLLRGGAAGARRAGARDPRDDELHEHVPAGGLLDVGRARGRRHARFVSRPRRRRRACLGGVQLRPDAVAPRRSAVAAARARHERGQLARGERAEASGTDAAVGLPGARPRLRRRHVLPVACGARRRREVPQRDGSPRGQGGTRLGRNGSPRARARGARGGRRLDGARRCRLDLRLGQLVGVRRRRPPIAASSTCRRSCAPGTDPSSTGTSPSTSSRPAATSPATGSSSPRTCTCSRTRRSTR